MTCPGGAGLTMIGTSDTSSGALALSAGHLVFYADTDRTVRAFEIATGTERVVVRPPILTAGRFAAHDEQNQCQVGDRVTIVSCRPLSKSKRWRVREVVQTAGGVS